MSKVIQKIRAWRYPCDGKPFFFEHEELKTKHHECKQPMKSKKYLLEWECNCRHHCKPEQIEIIVRKVARKKQRGKDGEDKDDRINQESKGSINIIKQKVLFNPHNKGFFIIKNILKGGNYDRNQYGQ